jgi:hypothetical protein
MATSVRLLLIVALLGILPIAAGETLPDPTHPSIDLNSSGSGSAPDLLPDETATRGLQSIIISPLYRAAIINGETVTVGGTTGDSRLVEVRENSVVLQNAQGRRVLELFPKVSLKKNDAVRFERTVQEKATGQTSLPESAAGGIK